MEHLNRGLYITRTISCNHTDRPVNTWGHNQVYTYSCIPGIKVTAGQQTMSSQNCVTSGGGTGGREPGRIGGGRGTGGGRGKGGKREF